VDLEYVFDYDLTRLRGPLASTAGSPTGTKQYSEMTEGTLSGERIRATMALPGGDWMTDGGDRFGRPDVRVQWVTDDAEIVLMAYYGLVEQNDTFMCAAEAERATDFDEHHMRMALRFDTGAQRYRWLMESLFVARGRLRQGGGINYQVYRLT
jgi:hypothetical protein